MGLLADLNGLNSDCMSHILSFVNPKPECCIYLCASNHLLLEGNKNPKTTPSQDLINFAAICKSLNQIAHEHFHNLSITPRDWSVAQGILKELGFDNVTIRGDRLSLHCSYSRVEIFRTGGELSDQHVNLIKKLLSNSVSLHKVSVENYSLQESFDKIAKAMSNQTNVSHLCFSHTCLTSDDAKDLASALTQETSSILETLDLSNPNAENSCFKKFESNIQNRTREVQFNDIDDAAATALVDAVIAKPQFRILDLSGNLISNECAALLTTRMAEANKILKV